ncbi:MAG: hypothetical protein NVSMB4_18060 [Acidimicrobiales bacterium]
MSADVYSDDGYYAIVPEAVLMADISAQAVRLYAVLRRYADKSTGLAHPSRATLAKNMRVKDPKVVDRAAVELTKLRVLTIFPRWISESGEVVYANAKGLQQTSNGYRILRTPFPFEGGGGGSEATPRVAQKGDEPQSLEPQRDLATATTQDAKPDRFDEWYSTYPKKVAPGAALKAYKSALKKTDPDTLLAALKTFVALERDNEIRFLPNPATWLNGERWKDEAVAGKLPHRRTADDARAWLKEMWQAGTVKPVEDLTGRTYQPSNLPDDVSTSEQIRAFGLSDRRAWIAAQVDIVIARTADGR